MRRVPARLVVAIVTAVAGAAAVAPPGATAAPLHDCTPSRGTIVAVDFGHWGGPIVRGCGVGEHTGYALLHAAGFLTAGDQHDGPAFICRLGDTAFDHGTQYPTPAQQDCILTPPASAYWSFWIAPPGARHWVYSSLGAMSDAPRAGEVELWTFGATNVAGTRGSGVPSISPGSLRARAVTVRHRGSSGARPATTSTTTRTRTSATTGSMTSTGPRVVAARPSAQPASSETSTPLIVGIVLILLLGAGATWVRRRRE